MKNMSLALFVGLAVSVLPNTASAQKLTGAKIVFNTYSPGGDDKDHDTKVTVKIYTRENSEYNKIIASKSDFDGDTHYKDPSVHEKGLDIAGTVHREDVNGLRVYIHIEPHGHDTWKFHYRVQLQFSDGSILEKGEDGIRLSEDDKTHDREF